MKTDLSTSQHFNIALALKVPVRLLVCLDERAKCEPRLANSSADMDIMSSEQLNEWLSDVTTSDYRVEHSEQRNDRAKLDLRRQLEQIQKWKQRLEVPRNPRESKAIEAPVTSSFDRLADLAKQAKSIGMSPTEAGWRPIATSIARFRCRRLRLKNRRHVVQAI